MTLDVARLTRALARGPVARVVVAAARGSSPREAGAEMLVHADGILGTIGGGALEWRAIGIARAVLADGAPRLERMPLGPALGQCCGGAVTLAIERVAEVPPDPWVRRVSGTAPRPDGPWTGLRDGWMSERHAGTGRPLWIWGAGHVGRALAAVAAPLPGLAVTWIDVAADRFPETLPPGVTRLVAARMPPAMRHAPAAASHLIVTHSHEIDLDLCHAALDRGFRTCGLIGSATKWARFRARLAALGHAPDEVGRIDCPIGDPALGKHPQAIAVGTLAGLLSLDSRANAGSCESEHDPASVD